MVLTIVIFILVFFLVFSVSLFCLIKTDLILENYHLIIPSICISLWAFYYLLQVNFVHPHYWDFEVFYKSGKRVLNNPLTLYEYLYALGKVFFLYVLSVKL